MSAFAKNLLDYHTSMTSSQIGFENLKRLHPSLNEDNVYALAIMATNPAVPEEEREIFMRCLKMKQMREAKAYESTMSAKVKSSE